ncbi:hypothetical protein PHYSODRAFT_298932 [Phytophthora sojae]|uniref:Uncharacterized protein n=1 Tax=Phytophthora sojae (strain P6497) TaxID=1094619 RepID=G4Z6W4_PHYSP|nr:hypothetical protein PHYSODRAFT_298932 [Phytophthora sojae]EGZ21020.1 hypothetical protein PHYSODRAFT_298932 [Phytophthora sojae]|eukprot:XP_009523737.1 hypothetical protein PHYSODRAFT_298932 [Phytophthora sojae]
MDSSCDGSSGADSEVGRHEAAADSSCEEDEEAVVTLSVKELELWRQIVILQVEDHFTSRFDEQLKRIAELGRVHGTVVREATQYVHNMEVQLKQQFEADCAGVRAQAEEFVAKARADNKALKRRVKELEVQANELKAKKAQKN